MLMTGTRLISATLRMNLLPTPQSQLRMLMPWPETAEHAGGVLGGFAVADLQLVRSQVVGVAAQLGHARLEANCGCGCSARRTS